MAGTLPWSPPQQSRLDQWGIERSVDVHCHCLPGVDDGPGTLAESLKLCKALAADGITTVAATPHQLGGYDRTNTAGAIRAAVIELNAQLAAAGVPVEVVPGGDVRVDERLAQLVENDAVLTIADGRKYMLLELPHEIYVDPLSAIASLADKGIQAIMTHPERHRYLVGASERIASWVVAGAALQITAGSLVGDFGRTAEREAWRLVQGGLVSLVATDAHDALRRPPRMSAALEALAAGLSADVARLVCLENPWRVLRGEPLETYPEA